LPGNRLVIDCCVIASPKPELKWKRNNETQLTLAAYSNNINPFKDFVDEYESDGNSTVGSFLNINLNKEEKNSQYKCLMNDSVVINDLNVTLIGMDYKVKITLTDASTVDIF
jgi:hypothetical protein